METLFKIEAQPTKRKKRKPTNPLPLTAFEAKVLDRIRELVANGECTVFALSRDAGISQCHVHGILRGKNHPSIRALTALATAAEVGWSDIVDIARGYEEDERGAARLRIKRWMDRHARWM
jgi:transcriptional regulator with XRE-family HTH domain